MSSFLLIVFLFFMFCFGLGIIKPSWIIRWGAPESRTRKKVIFTMIPAMIISFICFGLSIDKEAPPSTNSQQTTTQQTKPTEPPEKTNVQNAPTSTNSQQTTTQQTKPTEPPEKTNVQNAPTSPIANQQQPEPPLEKIYSLGLTPEQFKNNFDDVSKEASVKPGKLSIKEGAAQNSFSFDITPHTSIVGIVNKKDGSVRSVFLTGVGDGTLDSGANIMLSVALLIGAVNPEIAKNERGDVMKNIGLIDGKKNGELLRYGRKYKFDISDVTGLMFFISNPDDK